MNIIKSFLALLIVSIVLFSCSNANKKDKDTSYYDTLHISDKSYEVYTMCDSLRSGVMYKYYRERKIEERLYINNELLISKRAALDPRGIAETYFYNVEDTLRPIGFMWYDSLTHNKLPEHCTYFDVISADTIKSGQPLKVKLLWNITSIKNLKIELRLGEITSDYKLISIDTTLVSNYPALVFEIDEYDEGLNLIVGQIYIYSGTEDITNKYMYYRTYKRPETLLPPYVFYKQFYVTPADVGLQSAAQSKK